MAKKVLIDTDPGIDDTMAILTAFNSPELEIVGLTTVFGNSVIENCTANALRLVELARRPDVPVASGAGRPMVVDAELIAAPVHGEDGMGNTYLPAPQGQPVGMSAAEFIVKTVLENPGEITLAPLGPLTNIALALMLEPKIAGLVKEVVLMGGAATVPGNISPVAEANIFHDAHAAERVFGADWPVVMVGLDVTTRVMMTPAFFDSIFKADTPYTRLLQKMLPVYQGFHHEFYGMNGSVHTHDPSTITYLLRPDFFQTEEWPVHVETTGRCAGFTIADRARQWGDRRPARVCVGVDAVAELGLLHERLTRY